MTTVEIMIKEIHENWKLSSFFTDRTDSVIFFYFIFLRDAMIMGIHAINDGIRLQVCDKLALFRICHLQNILQHLT